MIQVNTTVKVGGRLGRVVAVIRGRVLVVYPTGEFGWNKLSRCAGVRS